MKITTLVHLLLATWWHPWAFSNAFAPFPQHGVLIQAALNPLLLRSSTVDVSNFSPSDVEGVTVSSAKAKLLEVAEKLKANNSFLVLAKAAKDELKDAVQELESAFSGTYYDPPTVEKFLGNWTLLVSTSTNRDRLDASEKLESLPSVLSDPLKKLRSHILDATNRYLMVQQKVRSTKDDGNVDRVDIILELEPPEQLGDLVMENIPEQLRSIKLNPLEVSKSKLILIHDAKILSQVPLKTKITLKSIVLNVAGTSRVLDPNGKDIAGINLPNIGEFLPNSNSDSGEFVTTFVDDDLRISRGKLAGNIEQLRVFARTESPTLKVNIMDEVEMDEEIVDIEPLNNPVTSLEKKKRASSSVQDDDDDDLQPSEMDP